MPTNSRKLSRIDHFALNLLWVIGSIIGLSLFAPQVHAQAIDSETEAVKLPDGFAYEPVVSGLSAPIDMAVLPSGDMLIIEKGVGIGPSTPAVINLLQEPDGAAIIEPLLTLNMNASGDSGLLSILLDPNFADNKHFYIWHSSEGAAQEWKLGGVARYRLSRFTLDTETRAIDPASQQIIIDNVPRAYYHNGGGLAFNNQGQLFIALGDAGMDPRRDSHPTQDQQSLLGKVLRIVPTDLGYTVPAGNPYLLQGNYAPEVYAVGFRNPFRMAHRAADDAIFIGDVGQDVWEELSRLRPAANYGWPVREGPCPRGQRLPCAGTDEYENPVMFFEHPPGLECCVGGSITGMAFYEGSTFPADYHGLLFVADYNAQTIAAIKPDSAGFYTGPHFAENIGYLTDIEYADERLYLLDIFRGTLARISYYGADSPPTAVVTADKTVGAAPLTVQLDAGQSAGANEQPLTYEWRFDSANSITGTVPTVEYTFTEDGNYTVELVTIDSQMRRSPTATLSVNVYSGELPQIDLAHTQSISRTNFYGGDTFSFAPIRSAGRADLNPEQPYTWDLVLHHNQHVHPLLANHNVMSDTLSIPRRNHGGIDVWYEIGLTIHTASGQAIRVAEALRPAYTQVSIETIPPLSGTVSLDGHPLAFPSTTPMIVDVLYTVEMPKIVRHADRIYHFEGWVDAVRQRRQNSQSARTIMPSAQPESLRARYVELDRQLFLPFATLALE